MKTKRIIIGLVATAIAVAGPATTAQAGRFKAADKADTSISANVLSRRITFVNDPASTQGVRVYTENGCRGTAYYLKPGAKKRNAYLSSFRPYGPGWFTHRGRTLGHFRTNECWLITRNSIRTFVAPNI